MPNSDKLGYTLIELLIAITITSILIASGLTAYRQASIIQATRAATEKILSTLTSAQKAATTGDTDCSDSYLGQILTINSGSSDISITSSCSGGELGTAQVISLTNFTFTSSNSLTFRPFNQGIDTGVEDFQNIDYTDGNTTHRINVERGGTIQYLGKISP